MLENFRTEERNEGQAAGLVDTLGRLFVRAIGLYRRDIRRRASCESLEDLFTVRFAPHTLGTHRETRQRLFVDSEESVWTEKPRESGKRRILRVRVSNDSARWTVSTVSRFEKFGFQVGSTSSARRATFSKFLTAVIVQWQFGCFRRDATIHELDSAREKFSSERKTKVAIYVCRALIPSR